MGRVFGDYVDDTDYDEGVYLDAEEYFVDDTDTSDPERVFNDLGIDLSDWLRDNAD